MTVYLDTWKAARLYPQQRLESYPMLAFGTMVEAMKWWAQNIHDAFPERSQISFDLCTQVVED